MTFEFIKTDTMPKDGVVQLPTRVLPFIWYFARQVKWQLFTITFCFAVSSLMFTFLSYGVKGIVDAFTTPHGLDLAALWYGIFVFFTIFILRFAFECLGDYLAAHAQAPYANFIRRQIASYVNKHSYRYFQDDFAGRIAAKVLDTPKAIRELTFTLADQVVYTISLVVGTAILFASVSPLYLLVIVLWVIVYALILRVMIPLVRERTRVASKQINIVHGRYVDIIVNVLQVKLFARQAHEDREVSDMMAKSSDLYVMRARADMFMSFMVYLSILSLYGGSLAVLSYDARYGGLTAGEASMIMGGLMFMANSSVWVSRMISSLFQTYGEIYEGIDLITQSHDVQDRQGAGKMNITRGEIVVRDLNFSYPGRPVFKNLNLRIPPGQKVGLLGPSGAGKSTFIQILLRLFDVQGGAVDIDGQNIAEVQQESLRGQIAVIPQNSDLLHRSIRENILYGRLDATDDDMIRAAMDANAHDFILELQDKEGRRGYDAHVGERGVKLSGGQRQRIAIARAVLKDARVLLLDEATSALDSESEAKIQESLFNIMAGRTVIAIAHRLSTIQHMDRLLVMKEGQIIEDGSHAELLAKNGYYATLWARQAGGFLKI